MNVIDKEVVNDTLKDIDEKIDQLNNQKIKVFLESLRLHQRNDISRDYLNWKNILIVVPGRGILEEVKKYKESISRISSVINSNSEQIYIYDFNDWKNSTRNKTQFLIRELLKNIFGGTPKIYENRGWVKLL
ncbi:hypothetical protein AR687_22580 [Flavobacteriaceae bacterium CRH]|nr:hypothetical protein AR687_22580 [Flavobacteriaceae bacterium CRH]